MQKSISRDFAFGLGIISIVALTMFSVLLTLIADVSESVAEMRRDETAIRQSMILATSIREQYIHQAHWIIGGDPHHLDHYEDWVDKVATGVAVLKPLVPDETVEDLDTLAELTAELDLLFKGPLKTAHQAGERAEVIRLHEEAEKLSTQATVVADSVVNSVERKMARAHVMATRSSRLGLVLGIPCVLLIIALSLGFTIRLRKLVLEPMSLLSAATQRFGAGDFEARVGPIGQGELAAVGAAFDRMAEELEKRERKLIQSERMAAIGQLAAGVAHEINNPIQVIRGFLKSIEPETPPQTLEEELRILDDEAALCQRIVEDLLAFATPPALSLRPVDMNALLEEAVRRFAGTEDGRHNKILIEAESIEARCDAGRLRQVFLNLLFNAAQVSQDGQPIVVTGKLEDRGWYVFTVQDRGPGVSKADRARIFEPFFTKRPGGTGLGLAVSQGIVRAHGGSIHAQERSGGGSIFSVTLPLGNSRNENGAER